MENDTQKQDAGLLTRLKQTLNSRSMLVVETGLGIAGGLTLGAAVGAAIMAVIDNKDVFSGPMEGSKSIEVRHGGSQLTSLQQKLKEHLGDKISFPDVNAGEPKKAADALDTIGFLGKIDAKTGITQVSYTFDSLTSHRTSSGDDDQGQKDFTLLNDKQRDMYRAIFAEAEQVASIKFIEIENATPDDVNLTIRAANLKEYDKEADVSSEGYESKVGGYASYPREGKSQIVLDTYDAVNGVNSPQSAVHELLHAAGFSHPQKYSDEFHDGTTPLTNHDDHYNATQLSYHEPEGRTSSHQMVRGFEYKQEGSLSLYDVLAMQAKYGINKEHNKENNSYTMQSGDREVIWDAGGYDILNASAATGQVNIDLNAGAGNPSFLKEEGKMAGAVWKAFGAKIEAAKGSAHNDKVITDHDMGNHIDAGAGDDLIHSQSGGDVLTGGDGANLYQFDLVEAGLEPRVITDFVPEKDMIKLPYNQHEIIGIDISLEPSTRGTILKAEDGMEVMLFGVQVTDISQLQLLDRNGLRLDGKGIVISDTDMFKSAEESVIPHLDLSTQSIQIGWQANSDNIEFNYDNQVQMLTLYDGYEKKMEFSIEKGIDTLQDNIPMQQVDGSIALVKLYQTDVVGTGLPDGQVQVLEGFSKGNRLLSYPDDVVEIDFSRSLGESTVRADFYNRNGKKAANSVEFPNMGDEVHYYDIPMKGWGDSVSRSGYAVISGADKEVMQVFGGGEDAVIDASAAVTQAVITTSAAKVNVIAGEYGNLIDLSSASLSSVSRGGGEHEYRLLDESGANIMIDTFNPKEDKFSLWVNGNVPEITAGLLEEDQSAGVFISIKSEDNSQLYVEIKDFQGDIKDINIQDLRKKNIFNDHIKFQNKTKMPAPSVEPSNIRQTGDEFETELRGLGAALLSVEHTTDNQVTKADKRMSFAKRERGSQLQETVGKASWAERAKASASKCNDPHHRH